MGTNKDAIDNIYIKAPGIDLSSLRTDIKTFNIINAMDGTRSVSTIASEDFYEIDDLVEHVKELVKLGLLVTIVGGGSGYVDQSFIIALQKELTDRVGPVAGKIVLKKIAELGYDQSTFPVGKVGELLDMLSSVLQDHGQRLDFKNRMMKHLNK